MMRTKLARKYGSGKTVEAYINLAAGKQELNCLEVTIKRTHEIYEELEKPVIGPTNSMLACVVLFLAAKSTNKHIASSIWTNRVCAYPTLYSNAKSILSKLNDKGGAFRG